MSPEYKVSVPPEKAEEFVALVGAIDGAQIIGKPIISRPADYKDELTKYLASFAERINRLSSPASEVEVGVWTGYQELLRAAVSASHNEDDGEKVITRPLAHEEMRAAVLTINNIFLECTRVDPDAIRQGKINYTHWPRGILGPREIDMLIIKFGLEDGNQRSYADLAAAVELSQGYCRVLIDKALRRGFGSVGVSRSRANYREVRPFVDVVELNEEEISAWKKKRELIWRRTHRKGKRV